MLGAIADDVIGSVFEGDNVKTPDFEPLFHPEARPTPSKPSPAGSRPHLTAEFLPTFAPKLRPGFRMLSEQS